MATDPAKVIRKLSALPQLDENWYLAVRKLSVWISKPDDSVVRPYLAFLMNIEDEIVQRFDLALSPPGPVELQKLVEQAMLKPFRGTHRPAHRPRVVSFEQGDQQEALAPFLAEIGVDADVRNMPELSDSLVKSIENQYAEEREEGPGLMTIEGITLELCEAFYTAAAAYYRQEPWIFLDSGQPVAFELLPEKFTGYAQIMGNDGIEYGLILHWSWEELEQLLTGGEPGLSTPKSGWISISYSPASYLSSAELDAIEAHNWPIVAADAYPLAVALYPDHAESLDLKSLQAIIALLQNLAEFIHQLTPDLQGDYQPLKMTFPRQAGDRQAWVTIEYPAGDLPDRNFLARLSLEDFPESEELDSEITDDIQQVPREQLAFEFEEDEMSGGSLPFDELLLYWQKSPIAARNPELVKAMGYIYKAYIAESAEERLELARRAIQVSPDCADGYLLLGNDLAVTPGQAFKYFQQGLQAAKRALGEDFFTQSTGEFSLHIETRPYLRLLEALVLLSWDLNHLPEALAYCEQALELDQQDALYLHKLKLSILLDLGRYPQAYQFAHEYPDTDADWLYNLALIAYHLFGNTSQAETHLQAALQANAHVPDYLSVRRRLPNRVPEDSPPGTIGEAINYSIDYQFLWNQTPGAIDWLRHYAKMQASTHPSQPRSPSQTAARKKKKK